MLQYSEITIASEQNFVKYQIIWSDKILIMFNERKKLITHEIHGIYKILFLAIPNQPPLNTFLGKLVQKTEGSHIV